MYLTSLNPTWVDHTLSSIDPYPGSSQNEYFLISFSASRSVHESSRQVSVLERKTVLNPSSQDPENPGEVEQSYVELAVDILRVQRPESIQSLKDFLTVLPNPRSIEDVLIRAIYQLAEIDDQACRWILRHSNYLMPELDVKNYALQWVCFRLQAQGFVLNQDFQFTAPQHLQLTEYAQLTLCQNLSRGDSLILTEIFNFQDC
ncbi:hypothetical protein [Planktothrix sp. FACHB-1365]|uniref:hypothetical protein n=1 Tax=Planktothrix sp. FACHB-1365 TaxID=2692855 RepID=UPI0018EF5DC3|nr:hypothetical protein [Planktothrix sp. FACHB-1365]